MQSEHEGYGRRQSLVKRSNGEVTRQEDVGCSSTINRYGTYDQDDESNNYVVREGVYCNEHNI